jgi:hypothetical protein
MAKKKLPTTANQIAAAGTTTGHEPKPEDGSDAGDPSPAALGILNGKKARAKKVSGSPRKPTAKGTDGTPSSRELTDIPEHVTGVSNGRIIDGEKTALIYEAKDADWPHSGDAFAVLLFEGCSQVLGGFPNNEAFANHPLYPVVNFYTPCEVLDSPWLAERCRIGDKDKGVKRARRGMRHFVFPFKKNTVEFIAKGYQTLGVYPTLEKAVERATTVAYSLPPRF